MTQYNGPATLILSDGKEVPVEARLTSSRVGMRDDWQGTLSGGNVASLVGSRPESGRIRLPDGKEADLVVVDMPMEFSGGGMSIVLKVQGSGGTSLF